MDLPVLDGKFASAPQLQGHLHRRATQILGNGSGIAKTPQLAAEAVSAAAETLGIPSPDGAWQVLESRDHHGVRSGVAVRVQAAAFVAALQKEARL